MLAVILRSRDIKIHWWDVWVLGNYLLGKFLAEVIHLQRRDHVIESWTGFPVSFCHSGGGYFYLLKTAVSRISSCFTRLAGRAGPWWPPGTWPHVEWPLPDGRQGSPQQTSGLTHTPRSPGNVGLKGRWRCKQQQQGSNVTLGHASTHPRSPVSSSPDEYPETPCLVSVGYGIKFVEVYTLVTPRRRTKRSLVV